MVEIINDLYARKLIDAYKCSRMLDYNLDGNLLKLAEELWTVELEVEDLLKMIKLIKGAEHGE